MAKAGTLASDFATPPAGITLSGSAAITNGQLVLPTSNPYSVGAFAAVDFTSTFVYVQVVAAGGVSGTRQTSIKAVVDANNSVEMVLSGGVFKGRKQVAGTNTDVTLATYSATTHAWWRMREASGTVFWDTSPDGVTWTNLSSAVHGLTLTSVTLNLQAGYYGAVGSETGAANSVYDNLNWQIVTDTSLGTARAIDKLDNFSQPNVVKFDTPDVARVAGGGPDVAVQPVTLSDTSRGVARSPRGVDVVGIEQAVLDTSEGLARSSGGGPDILQGAGDLDPGGASRVAAMGQPDVAAVGVVVVDQAASGGTALYPGSGTYPGSTVYPGGGSAPFTPVALGAGQVDAVGAVVGDVPATSRALSVSDALVNDVFYRGDTLSFVRALRSPDVIGVSVLEAVLTTAGAVAGFTPGTTPGAYPPARAFGQPDRVTGATAGALTNLPILRVLADFTQGPPNQPASTAGGTTVELTQSLAATAVTIRRGRQYELGKPQAGTAQITFSDPDELLNPTNSSSPYNSAGASLVSYRPMRVTAVWKGALYTIYTGYIERYPQTWTDAGFRGIKPLECVDGLAMLSNIDVHQSYFETIAADNPSIYIPYNEATAPCRAYVATSKALLSSSSSLPGNPRQGTSAYYQTQLLVGGTALRVVGSAGQGASVNYAGDTMPDGTPAISMSSKLKDPASTDASRATARVDTAGASFSLNTANSTIEFWFRWTSGVVNIGMCESVTDGEFDYPTGAFVGLYTSAGRLYFSFKGNATGTATGVEVSPTFASYTGVPDGQWHYAAFTFFPNTSGDGTVSVTCTLDAAVRSFGTVFTPAQIGINSIHTHATSEYGDPESQVSVAQFAYYPTALTSTQRTAHYLRGVGNAPENATDRFTRLMKTYWAGGATSIPAASDHTQQQDADFIYGVYPVPGGANSSPPSLSTVLQAQQMVDAAERGMTYFDASGVATFETRNRRLNTTAVTGTFGDGAGELPYTALEYDYDPTYVYTRTQITKSQGGQAITNDNITAQGNYGVRTFSDTIELYNEFDLFQLGIHILALYSTQRVRIKRLEIDPAAVGSDALWKIVLGLELSQRFTVTRRTRFQTMTRDYWVEQIEHTVDPATSTWKVRLQLSPMLYAGESGHVDVAGTRSVLGTGTRVTF